MQMVAAAIGSDRIGLEGGRRLECANCRDRIDPSWLMPVAGIRARA
jgi:hypothetical protein